MAQQGYIKELLRHHGAQDGPGAKTPCPSEWLLGETDFEQEGVRRGHLAEGPEGYRRAPLDQQELRGLEKEPSATCTPRGSHSMLVEATSSTNQVQGYSDASFVPMGGRSLGCSVVVYNDTATSWRCGRQSLVALSVAEAELIEAVNAVQQSAAWQSWWQSFRVQSRR